MNRESMLAKFEAVVQNPRAELDAVLATGKKAVGCMPVYCPREIVYAAGMAPFGVWGSGRVEISEAKKYFPAFICSVMQTSLEMGLQGKLNGLSAMMIPSLCDSMKCMGQNWKVGVPDIPFIPVYYPQNRRLAAGQEYLVEQYEGICTALEELGGQPITEESLENAIEVYNANRAAMRRFSAVACRYPNLITPRERNNVIKSGWFMDVQEHTGLILQLVGACEKEPEAQWSGIKVVTTGILADDATVLEAMEENGIAIAADEVAQESRQFRQDVQGGEGAPLARLARYMAELEGCSVLYDPQKKRGGIIVDMVQKSDAQGVVVLLTKFCDPEEFDYAILKNQFETAGIPHLLLEVDQQGSGAEKIKTALQTFRDIV